VSRRAHAELAVAMLELRQIDDDRGKDADMERNPKPDTGRHRDATVSWRNSDGKRNPPARCWREAPISNPEAPDKDQNSSIRWELNRHFRTLLRCDGPDGSAPIGDDRYCERPRSS